MQLAGGLRNTSAHTLTILCVALRILAPMVYDCAATLAVEDRTSGGCWSKWCDTLPIPSARQKLLFLLAGGMHTKQKKIERNTCIKTTSDTKKNDTPTTQKMAIGEQIERIAGVNHSVIHISQQLKGISLLTLVHAVCTRVVSSVYCAPLL